MQNTIKNSLESRKLKFQTLVNNPIQTVYKLGIGLDHGRIDSIVDLRVEQAQVIIYSICPTNVPQNQKQRITELITRINVSSIVGNFSLDYDDGEVRYKCAYLFDDTFPNSESLFMDNYLISIQMMNRYLPAIMSVLYSNVTPLQAYNQIENQSPDPTMN
mgnify:CR=1 FL=1|jgi:hypothetical protein